MEFARTLRDGGADLGIVGEGTMYHATRAEHVPSILRDGLRTGAAAWGVLDRWGESFTKHWSDDFYGRRPVYLLTEPRIPASFGWRRHEEGEETPVLVSVDARGLRLLPDIVTFENPHLA